ncbi:MAG: flagellar filament capping protein FliD [Armatimonadota bacterium]
MNVGSMSITGLVSDLDISSIITQLGQIRRRPVQILEQRKSDYAARLTAFQQLSARVLALSTAATDLCDPGCLRQVTARSSDNTAVAVSASAGAAPGTYQMGVQQLAQAHKISSGSVASADQALGLSGEILLGGRAFSIGATDTLQDIRDAINASAAGATASILRVSDTDHRLVITSLTTGERGALDLIDANSGNVLEALGLQVSAATIKHTVTDGAAGDWLADKLTAVGQVLGLGLAPSGTVQVNGVDVAIDLAADSLEEIASAIDAVDGVSATVVAQTVDGALRYRLQIVGDAGQPTFADSSNVLVTLGVLAKSPMREVSAAQDAVFTIDGVTLTRSTNAVDDALESVQLQLLAETGATDVTVTIERDLGASAAAVESLVSSYNAVIDLINANQDFDTETEEGGAFFGSPAILSLESDLRGKASALVNTLGGELVLASQVGLTADANDRLVFDSASLRAALQADPLGVERLFAVITDASDPAIAVEQYTSATADSGPAGWAVQITQPATHATAISAALPGGIALDETLTINGRQVTLTAGMTLHQAADLLNSLFAAQRLEMSAEVSGEALCIVHAAWGSVHRIEILSSLDDGVGGTDLGGASAGELASYQGQDVAGTINGEACTGQGRLLIANEGNPTTAGLTLRVLTETAGDKGVVRVSKGIAARLADLVAAAMDSNGSLTKATEGVSAEIEAVDEQIEKLEADVERYIQKLQADFALMETKMSQSQVLLDWMQLQVEHLWSWQRPAS